MSKTYETPDFGHSDYSRWMEQLTCLNNKPLWQVLLPGTHGSGTYNLSTDAADCNDLPGPIPGSLVRLFAATQDLSIAEQLARGIRYFDIRPIYYRNDFFCYNQCIGPTISGQLDDLSDFLVATDREVVIYHFSHFCRVDEALHRQLIEMISNKLGPFLYRGGQQDLFSATIGQLTVNGSVVVVYYDDISNGNINTPGIIRDLCIYGQHTESTDLAHLEAHQLQQLKNNQGSPDCLFLLAWTLKFQDWKNIFSGSYSLRDMVAPANRKLAAFVKTYAPRYRMNILSVDFFQDSHVVDIAVRANYY